MRTFATKEEFASHVLPILDRAEHELQEPVRRALDQWGGPNWQQPILDAAQALMIATFKEDAEGEPPHLTVSKFRAELSRTLAFTGRPGEGTAEMIERFVATASLNAGISAAAAADTEKVVLIWSSMHDDRVRHAHRVMDGQAQPPGSPFHYGAYELEYPGDMRAPIALWAGCRCVLRPDLASNHALAAAASPDETKPAVVVALPAADHPVQNMGSEQKHMTLLYLGKDPNLPHDELSKAVGEVAAEHEPFTDTVSGKAQLGDDKANVLLLDGKGAVDVRSRLLGKDNIADQHESVQQYPTFIPHVTLGYPGDEDDGSDAEPPDDITFDRLALWHGDQQTEYPLGGGMTAAVEAPETITPATDPIPWHGVLAPEGKPSGDGRTFAVGSLRNRDLPLPITWQRQKSDGHDGAVQVARLDGLRRNPDTNEMEGYGVFLRSVPEADQVVGMLAEMGRMGVSVDVDDASFDFDPDTEAVEFTSARICSAAIVSIPAFAEAYIQLGEAPWAQEDQAVAPADDGQFAISDKSWDGSQGRFTPEQWRSSCVLHRNNSLNKSDHAFPIKEPNGDLNRAAVHNAAARINQAKGWPSSAVSSAKASLRSAYKALGEDAPDSLTAAADLLGFQVGGGGGSSVNGGVIDSGGTFVGDSMTLTLPSGTEVIASDAVNVAPGTFSMTMARGSGWVTAPKATSRIHGYWTHPDQPGYAKIAWGTNGDFDRCRAEVGKYLVASGEPEFINQTCAQWHHDALGIWPSTHAKDVRHGVGFIPPAPVHPPAASVSLVASAGLTMPPASWFANPNLDGPTPLTFVEQDGMTRVFGHLATWGTCHTGFPNACVTAPSSPSDYAYFKTGEVITDEGPVAVGNLTLGGGHAAPNLGVRGALAHYDSTSSVVADVCAGDDDHGIWFSGWLRPEVDELTVRKLRAAALSGDWRRINGAMELIACLAVNVPGFPIPRAAAAVQGGVQTALVAAGILEPSADTGLPKGLVAAVAAEMDALAERRAKMAELASVASVGIKERLTELAERVNGE